MRATARQADLSAHQNTCSLSAVCLTMAALLVAFETSWRKGNQRCLQSSCFALPYCLLDKKKGRNEDNNKPLPPNQHHRRRPSLRQVVLLLLRNAAHRNVLRQQQKNRQWSPITRFAREAGTFRIPPRSA